MHVADEAGHVVTGPDFEKSVCLVLVGLYPSDRLSL